MNCMSTSLQAGDRSAARLEMHSTRRPPPGATPVHRARISAPQAERTTKSSSRGRIGRSTITVGAMAGAAAAAAGAPLVAGTAAPPLTAAIALPQAAETLALFFSRHSSAGAPPVGTPAQTFG